MIVSIKSKTSCRPLARTTYSYQLMLETLSWNRKDHYTFRYSHHKMNEPAERFLTPLAIESESEQPIIVVPSSFLGSNFCSNIGCCLLFAAIVRCSVFNWNYFPSQRRQLLLNWTLLLVPYLMMAAARPPSKTTQPRYPPLPSSQTPVPDTE